MRERDSLSMIKGRVAESLIEELFLASGYKVFRFGMENTVPAVMELLYKNNSHVSNEIRRMPDFVVGDGKDVFFIEVKFRSSGEFSEKDLSKGYPYENVFIILVSKKHIKCISVNELKMGYCITPTSTNYLGSRKEFDLDKELVIEFCDLAFNLYANV